MSKFRFIILQIGLILAVLATAELISRSVLHCYYNRKFERQLIQPNKYGSTDGLKSNATGTVWGKPFHTDDMGGRKATKRKQGRKKILVIGDSVTEGVGVEDSETFACIMNEKMDSFDIRNISLIGWSVNDYRNAVDTLLVRDSAKEVQKVYLFYCLNDIYGNSKSKELPQMAGKGLFSVLSNVFQGRWALYTLLKLRLFRNSERYYQYDRRLYEDRIRLDNVLTTMRHISASCKKKNVDFKVFLLPYRSQIPGRSYLPQKILSVAFNLMGNNTVCYDLLFEMPLGTNMKELYLFADEIHFSPRGHKVIADIVVAK